MAGRVFNFSAGPAALPLPVLERAAAEMTDWHGSGMSVMEMSHRGAEFIGIAAKAESDLRRLLSIPDHYRVLFLQGGALAQNALVPMNLLGNRQVADYVHTGAWSQKSIDEAARYCRVHIAASAEDRRFTYVPKQADWRLVPTLPIVHICTNETIGGVEYQWTPDVVDDRRGCAARRRRLVAHPVAADGRVAFRPDLRRSAEERRVSGRDPGHRA